MNFECPLARMVRASLRRGFGGQAGRSPELVEGIEWKKL